MKPQIWHYASGLSVKLAGDRLEWISDRRSDEWGVDQSAADFVANGPSVGQAGVSKSVLREILNALGHKKSQWLPAEGEEPTITLKVMGTEVRFFDDAYLQAHDDEGTKDIVRRYTMTAQQFWQAKKLRRGNLAADTRILQFVFSGGTELLLHDNGNLFIGTLAQPALINGAEFAARSRLIFYASGALESGTLANPAQINGAEFYGEIWFGENGHVKSGWISAPAVIAGTACNRGQVLLNEDGSVRENP